LLDSPNSIWAIENGFQYFNLECPPILTEAASSRVVQFKEGFGGRSVLRETMRLVLIKMNKETLAGIDEAVNSFWGKVLRYFQ
jgi:hypothetical protein